MKTVRFLVVLEARVPPNSLIALPVFQTDGDDIIVRSWLV
jgi:hypothetical protein